MPAGVIRLYAEHFNECVARCKTEYSTLFIGTGVLVYLRTGFFAQDIGEAYVQSSGCLQYIKDLSEDASTRI
jgi:hypothetical protein